MAFPSNHLKSSAQKQSPACYGCTINNINTMTTLPVVGVFTAPL